MKSVTHTTPSLLLHEVYIIILFCTGVEVPIEKLLPKILGRLGKENPSKRRCKVVFVQRKLSALCMWRRQFRYDFCTLRTTSHERFSACIMHMAWQPWVRVLSSMCTHSGTICPISYGSPVRQQVLRDVTRHFNQPFGNLPGFEHRGRFTWRISSRDETQVQLGFKFYMTSSSPGWKCVQFPM